MSIMFEKMNQICRVCLVEDNVMFSVFDNSSMDINISSMLMYCASVKVTENDGMPELLCKNCLQRLESAYAFKQECEQADQTIRSFLTSNGNVDTFKLEDETDKPEDDVASEALDSSSNSERITAESVVKVELSIIENEEVKLENDETDLPEAETSENEQRSTTQNLSQKIDSNVKKPQKDKATENARNYTCSTCNKTFIRHYRFWRHKKVHPFFTCYVCFQQFHDLDLLKEHEAEHTNKIYVCEEDTCDLQYNDCRSFILHKKSDHQIVNYLQCSKCGKRFSSHEKWDLHLQKHLNSQPFECEVCKQRFPRKYNLHKHAKVHLEKHKCDQCDKKYTSADKLELHKIIHSEDKAYSCPECGKKFVYKHSLVRHTNITHKGMKPPKREKKILCSHCGQTFARPADLRTHVRLHTGVKPFSCELCEYRCHDKQLLKSHMNTHSGLRPYKCSYCEKSFRSRSYLTIHERFHSGYRPYTCSTCQKGFTTGKDLKVHERTHTGVKLFNCEICSSSFTTLHYLRVHVKKHDQ